MTRIVVADDHALVRQGLIQVLKGAFADCEIDEASDAAGVFDIFDDAERPAPDLLILDLSLGESSGLEIVKTLRVRDRKTPILVLSLHDEKLYAERVLRAGADGYIMKSESTERLLEAVRRTLAGESYMSETMKTTLAVGSLRGGEHRRETGKGEPRSALEALSDREMEVFQLMGEGLSTRDISERLHLGIKTIETYKGHIKFKLNLKNATELMRYAVEWKGRI